MEPAVRFHHQVFAVFYAHGFISGLFSELPRSDHRRVETVSMCREQGHFELRNADMDYGAYYDNSEQYYQSSAALYPTAEPRSRSQEAIWTAKVDSGNQPITWQMPSFIDKSSETISTERADGDFGYLQGSLSPERQTSLPGTNSTLRTLNCG